MSQQVRKVDRDVRDLYGSGRIVGNTTKLIDLVMYLSILFLVVFGFLGYKKLKEQSEMLVL
jgi:hypothetical protein